MKRASCTELRETALEPDAAPSPEQRPRTVTCEKCVRTVLYAPIASATCMASRVVVCLRASASPCQHDSKVASWIRRVAPEPDRSSWREGRQSPEKTSFQPDCARWKSTRH